MIVPLILAALLGAFTTRMASAAPTFDQANMSFAAGNYRAAINHYEAILRHDGFSAAVLFNLGNAYYRDGQFGASILNFERARVLAPRDVAIAENLRLAREKAGIPSPKLNDAHRAADYLTPNTLAWIGSLALAMVCLGIFFGGNVPRFSRFRLMTWAAIVALLAVAIALAIRWPEFQQSVVVARAPARIAPATTAAESFTLKPGEQITIARTYGKFVLAQTPDGRSGWVSESQIGRIFARGPFGANQNSL
jgi:tetratricopeptide (TPR) repeat protein